MIVVDTTVWIDFLEARGTPYHLHLRELIRENAPLALTDLIYCEVLQGIIEDPTFQRTRGNPARISYPARAGAGHLRASCADLPRLPKEGLHRP